MTYINRVSLLKAITASLFLVLASQSLASGTGSAIDLARTSAGTEVIGDMQALSAGKGIQSLADALNSDDWLPAREATLSTPRQHTTIWLRATLQNNSERALMRWLIIEPWRVNRVDAFFLSPIDHELLWQETTGLTVPTKDRAVSNGKTVIPVRLGAGESQQLFVKIYSDSLPFISIESWDPVTYTQTLNKDWILLAALLAGIATLVLILAIQLNAGLLLTGIWLLVAFVFEAEKNGFFSTYLLSFLEVYSANLRASAWILTEQLFLASSIFLLGLGGHRIWQWFIILTAALALTMAALTFVLDGASIRSLGVLVTGFYAASWPFMILPALRTGRAGQLTLLALLSMYWVISSFLLLGYTFNFYYTSAFAASRIYAEILIALALILTYTWQEKRQLKATEAALREQESENLKALEQAVKDRTEDLNSALKTAQKVSRAKVNFLAQVSHDLRSPLTAILGYAQLQELTPASAPGANRIIQDRALYMRDLVDGLVDYARGIFSDDEKQHDIYLIAFIDNLAHQAHLLATRQENRFQLKIDTDMPTVIRCHSTQLQRILLNLLENSAKYTQKGEISLSIAMSKNDERAPSLIFRVSDTGRGIAEQDLVTIYDPFYQTSKSNPGAGLGLAISFELAESLGGKLHLESELGKGTTATCTIPYLPGDEQLTTPSLPSVQDFLPAFDARGQTAWVVEDSLQVRELLDSELSGMGFNAELAGSAEAFIEATAGGCKAPAVIITDGNLPGESGAAVLRTARALWPDTPVILLSGAYSLPPTGSNELSQERFNAYLSKPVDLLELRLKLAEVCHLEEH